MEVPTREELGLPWTHKEGEILCSKGLYIEYRGLDEDQVTDIGGFLNSDNRAFAVHAANSYHQMREALEKIANHEQSEECRTHIEDSECLAFVKEIARKELEVS